MLRGIAGIRGGSNLKLHPSTRRNAPIGCWVWAELTNPGATGQSLKVKRSTGILESLLSKQNVLILQWKPWKRTNWCLDSLQQISLQTFLSTSVVVIVIGVLELKVIIGNCNCFFCIIKRQLHNYFEMIEKRLGSRLNPDYYLKLWKPLVFHKVNQNLM